MEVTAQEDFSIDNIISELESAGVLRAADVIDSKLIETPCAYPIYDLTYADERTRAQEFFQQYQGLHLLGRNAQFSHVDVDEIFGEAKNLANDIVESLA